MEAVLGPRGLVAKAHEAFEVRPEQLNMACAVHEAFEKGRHLAVEAGTGVGKSFAYLVAAIDQAHRKKGKVLISTYTINLQQQLINKDLPFLGDVLPHQFDACLAKGRSNYLCLRRLDYAQRKQKLLFADVSMEIDRIKEWSYNTEDGSLSDVPFVPSGQAWEQVCSEHGNCRGRKCSHYKGCFYWRARRFLRTADIIVVNHAMMFSDLVLKSQGAGILPEYNLAVIDEAHNMEHVAEDHFGINISNYTVSYLLRNLYNRKSRKGVLAFKEARSAQELVFDCEEAAKVFFLQVRMWYKHASDETSGRCDKDFVDDNITESLKRLRLSLSQLAGKSEDEDDRCELTRYSDKCRAVETDIRSFLKQPTPDNVYWVEASDNRRKRVALRSAPLNVGPHIKQCLFETIPSVVMTSATLSCGSENNKKGFEFFTSRVGLEEFDALKLGSPFDYESQVTLYIEADLPEPNDADFSDAAVEVIKKYLLKTDGRAFVLFTSYTMLKDMACKLESFLLDNEMELLCQGGDVDRATLLETFRADERSVLFGTDSFWQGVDVPGESLSNVIIVKLPFAVPNHPLVQGRIELMKANGENPFFNYQLPTAIIKFKQGFGRLIRNKTDSGIVVVLDSRIVRKMYGGQFIKAVPKCRVEVVSEQM